MPKQTTDNAAQLSARIPDAMMTDIEMIAQIEMTSHSDIVRRALRAGLPIIKLESKRIAARVRKGVPLERSDV